MRWLVASLLLPVAFARAAASEQPARVPAYDTLRFNEDYSFLSDPDQRVDLFDELKYVPLSRSDPAWYLSLGGELRERIEAISNPDFGLGGTRDDYLLQRVLLYTDFHFGKRVRLYVQGISGLIWGEDRPPPPIQDDPLDLQFAFIDLVPWLSGDDSFTIRIGRFGMSLGSARLVATRAAPNIPFKFDGVELLFRRASWEVISFLTRPGEERTNGLDLEDDDTTFWGAYATHWYDSEHNNGIDVYYLGLARENSLYAAGVGTQQRHSVGVRLFGEKSGWDWDFESLVQFGRFKDDDLFAWTGSINSGYSWGKVAWQPRLGLKLDATSGDRDPNDGRLETFDPLFFKSAYFNDASLLRPSNIIDVHPALTVRPFDGFEVNGGVDVFWRYSSRDAVYDPGGFIQIPVSENRSRYLGTALDINISWRVQRHAMLSASYVYFFTDNYVKSVGGGSTGFLSTTLSLQF
jgi:Alginate export